MNKIDLTIMTDEEIQQKIEKYEVELKRKESEISCLKNQISHQKTIIDRQEEKILIIGV